MRIFKLEDGNIASFRALMKLFYDAFECDSNYKSNPPSEAYVKSLLDNPSVIHIVAETDSVLVGGLVAYVLPKFEQERSEIYIYDLAVHKDYRRQGIATKMINELKTIALSYGAWVVYVQADYEDDPAIKLYESLGTKEEVLHFDIKV